MLYVSTIFLARPLVQSEVFQGQSGRIPPLFVTMTMLLKPSLALHLKFYTTNTI